MHVYAFLGGHFWVTIILNSDSELITFCKNIFGRYLKKIDFYLLSKFLKHKGKLLEIITKHCYKSEYNIIPSFTQNSFIEENIYYCFLFYRSIMCTIVHYILVSYPMWAVYFHTNYINRFLDSKRTEKLLVYEFYLFIPILMLILYLSVNNFSTKRLVQIITCIPIFL